PPGTNGTTICTGRVGHCCAAEESVPSAPAHAVTTSSAALQLIRPRDGYPRPVILASRTQLPGRHCGGAIEAGPPERCASRDGVSHCDGGAGACQRCVPHGFGHRFSPLQDRTHSAARSASACFKGIGSNAVLLAARWVLGTRLRARRPSVCPRMTRVFLEL